MNNCPYCSHNVLRHFRDRNLYWYCPHCRTETPDLLIIVNNKATSHR